MISIEIPVVHGKYLHEVLESIRSQSYQDYEVIIVNSGPDQISDLIRQYGFKEIRKTTKLLYARYLAHLNSKGEYSLLLDETRYLGKDALLTLSSLKRDMIIIHEREVGNSIWIRQAQLDKDNIIYCNSADAIRGFALPRYFRFEILSRAFEALESNLKDRFYDVIFPDHELIYYEASKISTDIHVVKEPFIYHNGDSSVLDIARKYYRYGKSIKVLKGTSYENFLSTKRKIRKICQGSLLDRIGVYGLYLARGIPFILGKYL